MEACHSTTETIRLMAQERVYNRWICVCVYDGQWRRVTLLLKLFDSWSRCVCILYI